MAGAHRPLLLHGAARAALACAAVSLPALAQIAAPAPAPAPAAPYGGALGAPAAAAAGTTPAAGTQAADQGGAAPRRAFFIQPSVTFEETYTTNVGLDPNPIRRADFVTQIVPALNLAINGARTQVTGSIALPVLLYARTGSANNRVSPAVDVSATYEAVQQLFFIDAGAHVAQSYVSPFGPTSTAIENNPQNAYTEQSYRLSPYIKGTGRNDITYEVRDDNAWTRQGNTQGIAESLLNNAYTNTISASVRQDRQPGGWSAEYNRSDVEFTDQPSQVTELGRLRGTWRPHYQIALSVDGGYEHDRYPGITYSNPIYGAGVQWRPSEHGQFSADWEHRFFGGSYHASLEERWPQTVFTMSASRDVSSYPQLVAQLTGGGLVTQLLDTLYASRFPDPVARQQFIQQLIQQRGLPTVLNGALPLYSQRVYLLQQVSANAAFLGARNSVFFTVFRSRTRPIAGSDLLLPEEVQALDNNTQTGGNALWTHQLSPVLSLSANADYRRTVANGDFPGSTRQTSIDAALQFILSPLTFARAGARYQRSRSDISTTYDEAAVFIAIGHVFQ